METIKIISLIIPSLIMLFTLGNLVFSLGEIHENKSNVPKILLLIFLKLVIYVYLLNNLFYGLEFHNKLNTLLICFLSTYIIFETVFINRILFKVDKLFKKNNIIDNKFQVLKTEIIYNFIYIKNIKYWYITIIFNMLLFLINIYVFFKHVNFTEFNQNIFIFTIILILIKLYILKQFRTWNN